MSWRTFYPKVQSADNRVQTKKEKYVLPKPSEKNNFIRHCCNKTWTSEKDYKEHLKIAHPYSQELHPEKKGRMGTYRCSVCKRDFFSKKKYEEHLGPYCRPICKICNLSFNSRSELQAHKEQNHPIIHKCPICNKEVIDHQEKTKHLQEKHPGIYFCNFCKEPFESYGKAYNHMKKNHKYQLKNLNNGSIPSLTDCDKYISGKWTCIFCQKTFVNKDLYKQHYLEHIQKEGKKES